MNYQETATKLAKRAMTHPDPRERERLRLLSAAAALLARQQRKAEYFARRAQHYEQMALSEPADSPRRADLMYLANAQQKRCNQLERVSSLTPPDSLAW